LWLLSRGLPTLTSSWVPITTLSFGAGARRHLLRVLRRGAIVMMC
jgi:hypothetical protein